MAYNNYFPVGYQPYTYQPGITPQYGFQSAMQDTANHIGATQPGTAQSPQTGIIWVQGEAGARGYPVAPNMTVQLWDSEQQSIYLKSADASGMPSMKILDYTIRDNPAKNELLQKSQQVDLSGYVTREEFERKIEEISRKAEREDEQSYIRTVRKGNPGPKHGGDYETVQTVSNELLRESPAGRTANAKHWEDYTGTD